MCSNVIRLLQGGHGWAIEGFLAKTTLVKNEPLLFGFAFLYAEAARIKGVITLVITIFVTRNVECDSYVTFYAELKNVIIIFLSPIGFVWRRILNIGFEILGIFQLEMLYVKQHYK
jgi:hypothetical protein